MMRWLLAVLMLLLPGAVHAQQTFSGWYPEGPAWIGGDLYWAEMNANQVYRMEGGEKVPMLDDRPCGPTAIARYRENESLVLCHLRAKLLRLDADWNVVGEITAASDGTVLRNPNDATADGKGGVWFTDPGRFSSSAPAEGRLYHLAPDGALTRHEQGLAYGNGVHFDAVNGRLLLSEHLARKVWSYPLTPDGLGARRLVVDLDALELPKPRYPETGPDGLEIGPDGTLWIAEYGTKRLLGWQAERGLVAALEVDAPYITNIAFSGAGEAVITGSYTNHEPTNRGGIWLFDSQVLVDAAKPH